MDARSGRTLLLALAFCASSLAAAEPEPTPSRDAVPDNPVLNDKYNYEVGAWWATTATEAGLSGSAGGPSVVVSFEDTLGLEDREWNPTASFTWRIGERWRLDAQYFNWNRTAVNTLATEVEWGDQVYPVGTTVTSAYDFTDTRVGAGYSFFRRKDKELGVGIGLHLASFDASVEATGLGASEGDVLAPLPVLSLYGAFALTDEWALRVRTDWLSIDYGDYAGDVRDTTIDVLFQPYRHVGFGMSLRTLVVDVEMESEDWTGRARTVYYGPAATVRMSF